MDAAIAETLPRFTDHNPLHHDLVSVIMFALLAFSLYYFAENHSTPGSESIMQSTLRVIGRHSAVHRTSRPRR